jgi:hypothetical protein
VRVTLYIYSARSPCEYSCCDSASYIYGCSLPAGNNESISSFCFSFTSFFSLPRTDMMFSKLPREHICSSFLFLHLCPASLSPPDGPSSVWPLVTLPRQRLHRRLIVQTAKSKREMRKLFWAGKRATWLIYFSNNEHLSKSRCLLNLTAFQRQAAQQ